MIWLSKTVYDPEHLKNYVYVYRTHINNLFVKESILNWGEIPLSVSHIKSSNELMGWGEKAIEIRSIDRGLLSGVFMHKRGVISSMITQA